jgi:hypothetical protein
MAHLPSGFADFLLTSLGCAGLPTRYAAADEAVSTCCPIAGRPRDPWCGSTSTTCHDAGPLCGRGQYAVNALLLAPLPGVATDEFSGSVFA